jgi:hypothetical protein
MPETRKRLPLNAYMKNKIIIFLALFICLLSTSTVKPAFADPPTAVDDSYSTNEDTTLNIALPGVLANDTDPDRAH